MRVAFVLILVAALICFSQTPAAAPGAGNRPAISSSVRLEDWALFRSAASPILGWKVGVPARAFQQLTFSEAAARADALGLAAIEGFSEQKFSAEIPKNLDYKLTSNEREAVRDRLRALNLRMPAYFTATIGPDEASSRAVFEFAKSFGVETIVGSPDPASLPMIDKLATEFGVNVALSNSRGPKGLLQALEGRSKRIGANVDLAAWLQEGIKPAEGLTILKDRVLTVNLRDRIAPGSLSEFIRDLYRLEIKPSVITVDANASELSRSFENLDKALHPVITDRVNELSRTAAIRGPDRLSAEDRQKIEAALPQQGTHCLALLRQARRWRSRNASIFDHASAACAGRCRSGFVKFRNACPAPS